MLDGLPDRIKDRIKVTEECWYWTGPTDQGYGYVWYQQRKWRAHRVVYHILVDPNIGGRVLHHLCHERRCVRPEHLSPLSSSEHTKEHGVGGIGAINAAKETCPQGHPYDRRDKRGRICGVCKREADRQQYRKKVGREVAPRNGDKTHCKRGHEFTEENTYTSPKGGRFCRTCRDMREPPKRRQSRWTA